MPEGIIRYQGSGKSDLSIDAESETPTLWEAVSGASELLNSLLSGHTGDAVLYLQWVQQTGSATVLRFGYQPSEKLHEIFTKYCKTHNDGVFDAYTEEMKAVLTRYGMHKSFWILGFIISSASFAAYSASVRLTAALY